PDDGESCMAGLAEWLQTYAPDVERVCLVPESLTRNSAYVQNVITLQSLLAGTGRSVLLAVPEVELAGQEFSAVDGSVTYGLLTVEHGHPFVDGDPVDLCILNRDLTGGEMLRLSSEYEAIPSVMGWHNRRKSIHQKLLEANVALFASNFGIDPWLLSPVWAFSGEKCLAQDVCLEMMAQSIDEIIEDVQERYDHYGLMNSPSVFVKNDRGTYGLGILTVTAGSDLFGMSKRKLGRLTYGRGGQEVEDFVLQEGVPTCLTMSDAVAESVLYCVNGVARGAFIRHNRKYGDDANLNTPSSEYTPVVGDSYPLVHGIIAELSMLAMADECVSYSSPSSMPTIS
ncbi:MAG TPA: glutamate--cysteine ligase, partial [Candidatus Poseidoniales archaeon]|nr:glutamate--cysteine ligase [Candidatus Poseidoniales archaeon]